MAVSRERVEQVLDVYSKFINQGLNKDEARIAAGDQLGIAAATVERQVRHAREFERERRPIEKVDIEQKPPDRRDIAETWELLKALTSGHIETASNVGRATVRVDGDQPVAVAFISDEHIGAKGCNMAQLEDDARLVAATDGLYACLIGDLSDNFIFRGLIRAAMDAACPPKMQYALIAHYLEMYRSPGGGSKILSVIGGNHNAWTDAASGLDVLGDMLDRMRLLYDADQYELTVKVGGESYEIGMRHRARFNSSYNQTHVCKQLLRFTVFQNNPEVVVVAHHHEAAVETLEHGGRPVVAIRTPSAKVCDKYARKLGYRETGYRVPVVVFHPDEHKMTPFSNLRDAADYLKYLRGAK